MDYNYYKLILIVTGNTSSTNEFLKKFAGEKNFHYVNLNLALSEKLVQIPFEKRWLYVNEILDEILYKDGHKVLIVDNTEILFEKHLNLDPIGTLKNISRYKKIVASVRGILKDDCLVYARPGEEEYRAWRIKELEFTVLNHEEG
jgi:hypothetical protein